MFITLTEVYTKKRIRLNINFIEDYSAIDKNYDSYIKWNARTILNVAKPRLKSIEVKETPEEIDELISKL